MAIVDVRLRRDDDPNDRTGLDLIPRLSPTISIVCTGWEEAIPAIYLLASTLDPPLRPCAVVGKQAGYDELGQAINNAVAKYWPYVDSKVCLIRSHEATGYPQLERYWEDSEVRNLLRQLFPNNRELVLDLLPSSKRSTGLSLRSHSLVLQATADKEEPVVVKLARAKRAATERENYEQFVSRHFPGRFYGRHVRSDGMWDWACAVYEFMGSIEPSMRLFTDYYDQETEVRICSALKRLGDNLGKLYLRTRQDSNQSLFEMYREAWGREWCEKLADFEIDFVVPEVFEKWRLPNPVEWICQRIDLQEPSRRDATRSVRSVSSAIIHGDMHGENMFVDTRGDIWLIDYERSGPGPILQDWAELENDILTRLATFNSDEMLSFCDLAQRLLTPTRLDAISVKKANNGEIDKALKVIQVIRKVAAAHIGVKDSQPYLWGLLFNAVFRLMFWQERFASADSGSSEESLAHLQQCLLLGGLICHRLENIETRAGTWPPEQWSQAHFRAEHKNPSRPIASKNLSTLLTHEPDQSVSQRPDFLVVTALAEERDALLKRLPGCQKLPPSETDIATCFQAHLPVVFPDDRVDEYRVILMPFLSMGRMKAATATANAITRWHPRYVVLVGIAGGIANQGVRIGDLLIANQIVDYELQKITPEGPQIRWEVHQADPRLLIASQHVSEDSWVGPISTRRPTRGKPKPHVGPIASGDKVVAFASVLERYRAVWPKLIGVEMEAAGVATAAFQSPEKPGFFMIRCVSDLADENKSSRRVEGWRAYACDAAASFAVAFLKSGPILPAGQFK